MAFKDLPATCTNIVTGSTAHDIQYNTDTIVSKSKSEKSIEFKETFIVSVSFIGASYQTHFHFDNAGDRDIWYSDLV